MKKEIVLKLEIERHTPTWLVGTLTLPKQKSVRIAYSTRVEIMKKALKLLKLTEKEKNEN